METREKARGCLRSQWWVTAFALPLVVGFEAGAADEARSPDSVRARPYVAIDRTVTVTGLTVPLYFTSASGDDARRVVAYEPPVRLRAERLDREIQGEREAGRLVPMASVNSDGTLSIEVKWDHNGREATEAEIREQITS